jgi:hypothetical protein
MMRSDGHNGAMLLHDMGPGGGLAAFTIERRPMTLFPRRAVGAVLALLLALPAAPALAKPHLREVSEIDDGILYIAIANEIRPGIRKIIIDGTGVEVDRSQGRAMTPDPGLRTGGDRDPALLLSRTAVHRRATAGCALSRSWAAAETRRLLRDAGARPAARPERQPPEVKTNSPMVKKAREG